MKYLVLALLFLFIWELIAHFLSDAQAQEGSSLVEQLKRVGSNLHFLVGIAAVVIIVIVLARLIYLGVKWE